MHVAEQIARLRTEGTELARAAIEGPLDAMVPSCPGWDVEALVRHVGDVHRWASTIVRERAQERVRRDFEGPQDFGALLAWYEDGHTQLVEALEAASPNDDFWFWGPAPNALAFWARRQANETAVHRRDAELARGAITAMSPEDAMDALDEWLGLLPQRARAPAGDGRRLSFHATDGEGDWSIRLADAIEVTGGPGGADCCVEGSVSDLFLWSMNRQGAEKLTISGDATLLRVWRDSIRF